MNLKLLIKSIISIQYTLFASTHFGWMKKYFHELEVCIKDPFKKFCRQFAHLKTDQIILIFRCINIC